MAFLKAPFFVLLALVASGCQHDSRQQQTAALTLSPDALKQRQHQQRRFDTADERALLSASAGVLQDLGFTVEDGEARAGLIVASKDRDAVEAGQVAGQIFLAALVAAAGGQADPVWEKNQKIRISVSLLPSPDSASMTVRATFQRVIWNTKNQISRVESINDPLIHQEFFDRLSQAVFLEAHQI